MEEEFADLEKEKVIRELELKEMMAKHKTEIRNLEMQLSSLKVVTQPHSSVSLGKWIRIDRVRIRIQDIKITKFFKTSFIF